MHHGGRPGYGSKIVGRYAASRAVLGAVALSLAYRVNEDFSIGAGVSAVYTSFDEDIAVRQPGHADGRVSINQLAFQGGTLNPVAQIDRNWKDTYHLGVGLTRRWNKQMLSVGVGYDSSPVDDDDRTIDLPLDEQIKFPMAYGREGDKFDDSLGATLIYLGDGKVDQTAQGVRFKGEFDTNYALFLGGTLRYKF